MADDVAARFDCASRLTPGSPAKVSHEYGHHFGTTFRVVGPRKGLDRVAVGQRGRVWKIVSWQTEPDADAMPAPPAPPAPAVVRIKADLRLVNAAKGFLETWLIRKDYDAAFRSLSTRSYSCYDLVRGPDAPASTSLDDAGQKVRASLERVGKGSARRRSLDAVVEAAEPLHASIRVMDSRTLACSA